MTKGHSSDRWKVESGFVRRESQSSSWSIEREKIGKVEREVETECVVDNSRDLVLDSCADWEPVKGSKVMGNMIFL